jgi:hypothetical protein
MGRQFERADNKKVANKKQEIIVSSSKGFGEVVTKYNHL